MVGAPQFYGGFNLSPFLAMRMFDAVKEITTQNLDVTLSHVDDDNCEICQKIKAESQAKSFDIAQDKEAGHDAAQPGRTGREWAA